MIEKILNKFGYVKAKKRPEVLQIKIEIDGEEKLDALEAKLEAVIEKIKITGLQEIK